MTKKTEPKEAKAKSGEWGGKREDAGRKQELKEATTKSVVLDAAALKIVERYIKKNTTKGEDGKQKAPGFSEAVRALLKEAQAA